MVTSPFRLLVPRRIACPIRSTLRDSCCGGSVPGRSRGRDVARLYEQLQELDNLKTRFFSNVSHEFRTPLTLTLAPVEDLLAKPEGTLPPEDHAQLEMVHRNGLRLQTLVNTLLDFSRLEASRAQAVYEPVDLAASSAELASIFRAAVEQAGMRLIVDCPLLPEPVYLDRGMWETIVLNLLSNAHKFTWEGQIEVVLRQVGEAVELAVRDTGTGIAPEDLPRLFERFDRVQGTRGRTHEGTRIGLAMVRESVALHGGTVRGESVYGQGSTFTCQCH
jgi:signal transduction histidine kinase